MSYQQQQNPYSNPYTDGPLQPPPPPSKNNKPSGKMMAIMTGIIVPILVALISAGFLVHNNSTNNSNPTPVPTSPLATSAPTIPQLHSTYAGSGVNVVSSLTFTMSMINVSQQGESFTADMSVGLCVGPVTNGTVTQVGHVTFIYTQEVNVNTGCPVLNTSLNGTINSSGTITGQWSSDAGGNGSFTLS
jgi:hypothetical protein